MTLRQLALTAWLGCALLGSAWALLTPLTAVPDEATHVIRAVSLWQGDLIGRPFAFVEDTPERVEATLFEVTTPAGYGRIGDLEICYQGPGGGSAGCAQPLADLPGTQLMATIAGVYPPAPYVLYGAGSRLLTPTEAIYVGCLLSALLTAGFVAAAVACGWLVGGRQLVLALLLAITPVVPWLFGAINPSGLEIASSLALWTATSALLRYPNRRWVGLVFALSAAGVASSRPLAPVIAVGIITSVSVLMADAAAIRAVLAARSGRIAVVSGAAALVASVVWVIATDALSTFIARPDASLTPAVAAAGSWEATPWRLQQMVGVFGILDTRAPMSLVWAWAWMVVVVLLLGLWLGTWRQRGAIVALVVATLALPVLAEATTAAELGYTWQGRYTMPVATGALVASGWAMANGRRTLPGPAWVILLPVVAALAVLGHLLAALAVTARFAGGQSSALLGWFDAAPWSPPGPDLALLAAVGFGALILYAIPFLPTISSDAPAAPRD